MEEKQLEKHIKNLTEIRDNLKNEIIQLDDEILFQDFGVYKPQYFFAELDEYKIRLTEIWKMQRKMISTGSAVISNVNWKVNGSEKEGKKLIAQNSKQAIRYFNLECDICINKVKFSNYNSSKERIRKAYILQNELNETNQIEISHDYLTLKINELNLAYEYQLRKKEEREKRREENEARQEEMRVAREIEEKREELLKEESHYSNAIVMTVKQLENETNEVKREILNKKLKEQLEAKEDAQKAQIELDSREANKRAGYVYIISNIGAFGNNIYKIGMTRRLQPLDRISELSGASVPFRFDVHALIFSEDAPKLETALHNAFEDKKVNLVNSRKEFFYVTLDEIKKVVRKNFDATVEFKNLPDAEQYRTSVMLRRNK